MKVRVVGSELEDGSMVHDLVLETGEALVPLWEAPDLSSARLAESLVGLVFTRIEEAGSRQELARLLARVQEALEGT